MSLYHSCEPHDNLDAEDPGRQPLHLLSGCICRAVVSALIRAHFQFRRGWILHLFVGLCANNHHNGLGFICINCSGEQVAFWSLPCSVQPVRDQEKCNGEGLKLIAAVVLLLHVVSSKGVVAMTMGFGLMRQWKLNICSVLNLPLVTCFRAHPAV